MKTFNPDKKIKIEIYAPSIPVDGYTIYDVSFPTINKAITRKADDSDIQDILTENDFAAFENKGKYFFTVTAGSLLDKFQYLYS